MLHRERNHCEQRSASLIELPSSAMDKKINFKHVKPVEKQVKGSFATSLL